MSGGLALLLCAGLLLVPATAPAHDDDDDVDFGVEVFRVHSTPERTRVKVLDLILVKLFEYDRREERYQKVEVLDVPFFTLYESSRHDERTSTRFPRVPLFSLYRRDRDGEWESDIRLLSLPLIGSLYRHQVDGASHRRQVLFFIRWDSDY